MNEYLKNLASTEYSEPKSSQQTTSFVSPAYSRLRSRVANGIKHPESTWETIRQSLWSTEYLSLGMLLIFTALDIIYLSDVKFSFGILQINLLTMVAIIAFAMWYDQTGAPIAHVVRSFYVLPVGYMLYSQVHNYIPLVNTVDYDRLLAAWDLKLFGIYPTQWISKFSNPFLTEYLQIWYNLFQLMLLPPGIALYRQNRMREFRIYTMVIIFGFYLSYLAYFILPAIGPRFLLHDFSAVDRELPGIFLTHALREFINAGNGITPGMTNYFRYVNHDCMPSGHTMMSLLAIMMAWRFRAPWRWLVTIGGTSVIVATVYLRYHYVVDVIAGTVLALVVFAVHPYLIKWWEKLGVSV